MKPRTDFESKILTAFSITTVVVLVLFSGTWKIAKDATDATAWVAHTQEVLNHLARIQGKTVQIELATQNYRISGDPARLLERDSVTAERESLLNQVYRKTADNIRQQDYWQKLRAVIDERRVISKRVEEIRKTQGPEAVNAYVATAPLQATRSLTYALLDSMDKEERRLLEVRLSEQRDAREHTIVAGALACTLLVVLLAGTYVLIRRQLAENERGRQALAESKESLSITLQSIGDGVLATDTQGRVTRMNPVAEQLTGWSVADALGHLIEEVFVIVHEYTREPVEIPVSRVIQTGEICELANHTVLIGKGGEETPIADSAAPIRNAAGALLGVVLVFRDETVARLAKQSIREQNKLLEERMEVRTAQLYESQRHLRSIANNVPALIAYINADQIYMYVNNEYRNCYAPDKADIIGYTVSEVLSEKNYRNAAPHIAKVLQGHAQSFDVQPSANVWHAVSYLPNRNEAQKVVGYYVLGVNITERKHFELAQRQAGVVFDSCYEGIMVTDANALISRVNPSFTRITGYEEPEVLGRAPSLLSSGRHNAAFYKTLWDDLHQKDFWRGEFWNKRKNGEEFAALQSISTVRDMAGQIQHYVSVFSDISHIKSHEAELDRMANFDSLTNLPNRRLLSDRLNQSIIRATRNNTSCAVCFLDMDGFKEVNDKYGHSVGDELLVGISAHLQTVLRADDTLARLGGDEFVLLLCEIASLEECTFILERVLQTVKRPVVVDGIVLSLSASIGVSLYPADKVDPDTLLRHADQAMYLAKQAGKNRYQLFDPEIELAAQIHREYLIQIHFALERQEFVLFYQPQVDLATGDVIGVEALIRWQHPQRGLLSPCDFLPHLHGNELEWHVGEWVIRTGLRQIATWNALNLKIKVSVNISANHLLQANFCESLANTLAIYPEVHPEDFELEVLETTAIEDIEQAVSILRCCIKLGVKFSLDDFGTGYSSLTYLSKLPVETLKIDQSFVRDMLSNPDDMGIVQGVINLANAFHRQVIAEGVETMQHGAVLQKMGCRFAQGYGIARPMPATQLPAWCVQWRQSKAWESV